MSIRLLYLVVFIQASLFWLSPVGGDSSAKQRASLTGDPKIDYRMRVARAERTFVEMQSAAYEIYELATLVTDRDRSVRLSPNERKESIERMRKLAKRIRSDAGGSGKHEFTEQISSLVGATDLLYERAETLCRSLECSNRYEVNAKIINLSGDIEYLCEILKRERLP